MFGSRRCRRCFAVAGLFVLANGCGALFGPPPDDEGTSSLAVFQDPGSEFSTSDVHDVEDQIVRFDTQAKTIIWALDGRSFQPGVWEVNGNFLRQGNPFQVRFGNVAGERRAYFTETGPATICNVEVADGELRITATSMLVPQ